MKLFRSWPLYVVLAVFLGYLVFSEEESPEEGGKPSAEVRGEPSRFPSRTMNQTPAWQGGSQYPVQDMPPSGYQAYPGSDYPTDPPQANRGTIQ